jgi:eukaryotic-like serine/threonine-protein kinase
MNPEQWRKIREIFEAASDRPVGERAEFIAQACAGDEETRQRVEAMLAADAQENLLIDRPAWEAGGSLITSLAGAEDPQTFSGEEIGDYRLMEELGRGGMGTVCLAYDTRLKRKAALKILPSRLINNPERVRRFQREARAASALNHPNIITIYDFGQENGRNYIASEFVEGRTLRTYVGDPALTLNEIIDVAVQVARALEAAHSAGIVHRDIKPENIVVRPDGYVKVLDFGLAKLTERESSDATDAEDISWRGQDFETQAGMVLGTVNYMSPEQARGHAVDGRSDLFSLGVVLYELIAGRRPFEGKTWNHTLLQIMDREAAPIQRFAKGAPAALQQVLSRVLANDRERRYQTARELLEDLERLQGELAANTRVERVKARRTRKGREQMTVAEGNEAIATDEGVRYTVTGAVSPITRVTRSKLTAALSVVTLAAAAAYWLFVGAIRPGGPALTDKDTILLADFVNTTGDAVFDGTLKQGLVVQLEQSPYLNIFPEERARETLRMMERSPDDRITREVGREICQRRGIKALLVGMIATLGRNYVITLEAVNSQTGEGIAHQQTEAEGKEQVLKALGQAATAMREHLGESLASIRKFDAPIEQATTSSLEAFKDYTIGMEFRLKGQYAQAAPPLKRAIERDSQFALAYEQIGTTYRDLRNIALGNQYLTRAYELRDRVSERERITISATFFRYITGEIDKRVETTLLLTQTYPQDLYGHHLHGNSLVIAGDYEQAAEAYRAALRLDADNSLSRANLSLSLIGLNRFDEAQEIIEEGLARHLDSPNFRNRLYLIAFLKGDTESMGRQADWFTGRPDEYQIREWQARSFAFAGMRRQASALFAHAAALAEARGLRAEKARILATEANMNAGFGMTQLAEKQASLVLARLEKENIAAEELQPSLIQQLDSPSLAWTLALCGETRRAQSLAEDYARKMPLNTMHNSVWLPLVRATIESKRNPPVGPDRVVQLLQATQRYESALSFRPAWVRGQAYLQAKNGTLATAEFQRIIDHRGWDVLSQLWPLAHLGLARAQVLQGDLAKGRTTYESFFQLWTNADAELPILIEAKREYRRLGGGRSSQLKHLK